MKNKIVFILLLISYTTSAQKIHQSLIGKWKAISEIIEEGKDDLLSIDGNVNKVNMTIVFFKKKLNIIENGIPYKDLSYDVKKTDDKKVILSFGNRKYIIVKITDTELLLLLDNKVAPVKTLFRRITNLKE